MATSTQSVQSRFGPALVFLEGVLSLFNGGVLVDELLGDMVDNWLQVATSGLAIRRYLAML